MIDKYPKARFKFAGSWCTQEMETKKHAFRFIQENHLKDKIKFVGRVLGGKNEKFLVDTDIFVFPSWYKYEGHPIVIIEAMACGVPVISTNCPYGPSEIITDGVNGLLVPVGDTDAMAEAVLKLLKDEPLRKRLTEAGKKRAEDFRVEKMVAEYEKVFEEDVS